MTRQPDIRNQDIASVKSAHLGIRGRATNLDANHAKNLGVVFSAVTSIDENRRFYQMSQLNSHQQLFSVDPDLSRIPTVNTRQIFRSSIRDSILRCSQMLRKISIPVHWGAHSDGNGLALVPESKGEGNSGALSLEPFEMSGLNFQVSVEHIGTGSAGERKKD